MKDRLNQSLILKSKKQIGFAEYGDYNGWPVFHFHGHGNSRLEGEMFDKSAKANNVRLISVDRPGYGLSDFYERILVEWGDDINEIADLLNIKKYSVLGLSAGAPHALACLFKSPERIYSGAVVSLIGPRNIVSKKLPKSLRLIMFLAHRLPIFYKMILKKQFKIQTDVSRLHDFVKKNKKRFPKKDYELLIDDDFSMFYTKMVKEGIIQGINGSAYDTKVFSKNWGFNVQEISLKPKTTIWHGKEDTIFEQAKYISKLIPNCKTKFYQDEGHVSIALTYSDQIFKSLIP